MRRLHGLRLVRPARQGAGLPRAKRWGGHRERLPILAIAGQYVDGFAPSDYVREMEELAKLGLAGCKFKVGGLSPEQDAERVRAVRSAMGNGFVILQPLVSA